MEEKSLDARLREKVSWKGLRGVVGLVAVALTLGYYAYSKAQDLQQKSIDQNTTVTQELKTTTEVIETHIGFIKTQIHDMKTLAAKRHEELMGQLEKLNMRGGDNR